MATVGAALGMSIAAAQAADPDATYAVIDQQIAQHPQQTGAFVLEKGSDALIARAWLADHARESLDVQYFIWSTDNIGILAAEALLRAAERGVNVRVIVDDLLVDAPDQLLVALARNPHIAIRIYNPKTSAGVSFFQKIYNAITDFRGVNQRMHDKIFVMDRKVAITGGRNMAVEYFDYNQKFNFRDRDVMLVGAAAQSARASFDRFWESPLSVPVESIFAKQAIDPATASQIYGDLHHYAQKPENFSPIVRASIDAVVDNLPKLIDALAWGPVDFISDMPGKNDGGLEGGGRTSAALAKLLDGARERIVIESPYLVLSDRALALFQSARDRGVRIRICTNSMASTDNLEAFSGYKRQREELFRMGIEIFEARPDAKIAAELMQRAPPFPEKPPIFTMHAKSAVVDGKSAFIGTFNLDPRSENLNTEVGAILHDEAVAASVERAIEADMRPENAWSALEDDPDRHASLLKRIKVFFLALLPLRPIL